MREPAMKTIRAIKYKITDQRGASAVEFAIILPLLVVFVFGIIEFSILFYDKAVITNASREGERPGIVRSEPRPTEDEIRRVIYNYLDAQLDGTEPKRLISFAPDDLSPPPITPCVDAGGRLIITVTYEYGFLIVPDMLAAFFVNEPFTDGTTNIVARTIMRCE
jgi:hypothetical protein